jgi:lactate permease
MPVDMAFIAAANGALFGAWPICLIVFAAIFLYDVTVVTGERALARTAIVACG